MGQILQNRRILISVFLSAILISSMYLFAQSAQSPRTAGASMESDLLHAITTRDTDGDGLYDWEEALYGTSVNITDTFNLGMTDGEAVSKGLIVPKAIADISITTSASMPADGSLPPPPADGTLTAAFAKNFFTLYLSAKQANGGADLSESEMADIANQAIDSLASAIKVAPDFKSARDINVSGYGADALKAFAISAEAVFMKNTSNASKSEILYLQDAVQNNDEVALTHISSIAKGYRDSAVGISILQVPEELSADILIFINAMMRISEITSDFARAYTDPLATMLALKQYVPATEALRASLSNISNIYKAAGVSIYAGMPGALFVNIVDDIETSQKDAKRL